MSHGKKCGKKEKMGSGDSVVRESVEVSKRREVKVSAGSKAVGVGSSGFLHDKEARRGNEQHVLWKCR